MSFDPDLSSYIFENRRDTISMKDNLLSNFKFIEDLLEEYPISQSTIEKKYLMMQEFAELIIKVQIVLGSLNNCYSTEDFAKCLDALDKYVTFKGEYSSLMKETIDIIELHYQEEITFNEEMYYIESQYHNQTLGEVESIID